MPIRLRTRVFVATAGVLAAAISLSALLSRRATLVEVREINAAPAALPFGDLASTIGVELGETSTNDATALATLLQAWERTHQRALILIAPDGQRVVAGSNPTLAAARIVRATPNGDLSLETVHGGQVSAIDVQGVRPHEIRAADRSLTGRLYQLPIAANAIDIAHDAPMVPIWIVTTSATALLALFVLFTLSKHVLKPVSALTDAVKRMERGELDVRVADATHSNDEIGELAHAFNAMASRLAETERLRRQMVSDVAHELRSPVTNLRCTLESLQDGLVPLDRAHLDVLHEETLLLQRLISDLQELALADAGGLDLQIEQVSIGDSLRRAAATVNAGAGASIHVTVEDGLSPIDADPGRLDQILRNLLNNAQRHTPMDGRIEISVHHDHGGVRIDVRDTGSGIAEAHLPHVFDRFYRADQSRSRITGGAGLGLAIVRHLVSTHGGTIEAQSDGAGRGATFVIRLPARHGAVVDPPFH